VTSLRTAIEAAFADLDSATTCMRMLQIENKDRDWSWWGLYWI